MQQIFKFTVILLLIALPACGGSGGTSSAPEAPTNVVSVGGSGTVTTSWDDVDGATSYNMYMSTMSGVTPVETGSDMSMGTMKYENVTSPYTHEMGVLTAGTTYYCVFTALNAYGESAASEEVSAVP
ncbi:MAG: fibronectin type III domain-containing protein [Nitrospinota bacterium]